MNIWNTNQLVTQLQAGPLHQKEQFKYFLLYTLITAVALGIPAEAEETYSLVDFLYAVSSILITGIGTYLIYRVNARGDNKEFLPRIIALSLPISIRLIVLGMLLGTAFFGVMSFMGWPDGSWAFLFGYLFCVLFYWRLYIRMHQVAHSQPT